MVVIRLARAGAIHRPFYHVVVADSRAKRDGRYIERLGYLNYYARGAEKPYQLNTDRVDYWISHGAQTRPSVRKLLRRLKRDANAPVAATVNATPEDPSSVAKVAPVQVAETSAPEDHSSAAKVAPVQVAETSAPEDHSSAAKVAPVQVAETSAPEVEQDAESVAQQESKSAVEIKPTQKPEQTAAATPASVKPVASAPADGEKAD